MDDSSYMNWKYDISIWSKFTELPKENKAMANHFSLRVSTRTALSEVYVNDLKRSGKKKLV